VIAIGKVALTKCCFETMIIPVYLELKIISNNTNMLTETCHLLHYKGAALTISKDNYSSTLYNVKNGLSAFVEVNANIFTEVITRSIHRVILSLYLTD
jgi:hypothetical protein